ncbi:MAG: hypothetical protein WCG27_12310, partial [Pseudomonadota bacterium]
MAKAKISKGQKESSKNIISMRNKKFTEHKIRGADFRNLKLIREILVDSLLQGDTETFQDILIAYLRNASKSKLSQMTGLGRQTIYDLINEQREFNPTLSTLGA